MSKLPSGSEYHSRSTGKINIHISEASTALDTLSGNPTPEEKQTAIDTLRLSLQIASHKALRIQELENALKSGKLEPKESRGSNPDIIQGCVELEAEVERLRNENQELHRRIGLLEAIKITGT